MTIKELEQKTGMTRANIRFYEGEGLLSPRRLDNGYRDYSEGDARTLEKIRLLRQLQLDIDTIRKVQQGTLALEQALFLQQTKLEGDKLLMERAAQVCRELGDSGVEYAALDPQPYLARLEAPALRPVLPSPPPPTPKEEAERDTAPQACYHPWMRLFARGLDMALYDTLINVAWLLAFRDQSFLRLQTANAITNWVWSLLLLVLALAVEPLWLHFWGWTPGKWVFGLKLRDKDGKNLPLSWGFDRSKTLAWEGYAWNIPIFSLWVFWKNRKEALDGRNGYWNNEHACRYTKEERRFSGWAFVGARVVLLGLLVLGLRYTELPANRGALTVAEFSQNYNQYYRMLDPDHAYGNYLPELDREGQWELPEQDNGQTSYTTTDATMTVASGKVYQFKRVVTDTETWDQPEFTLEDGQVTAVALRMTCRDSVVYPGGLSRYRETLALLAMSGAVDGLNLFNYDLARWTEGPDGERPAWEDWETDFRGLRISQRVAYSGYALERGYGTELLICPDGETPCRCEKTVTISLIK